jgi:hypothetical protein
MITACKRALRGDHAHFLSGISEAVEYRVPWRRLIPDKGGKSAAIGAIFFGFMDIYFPNARCLAEDY